MFKFNTVKQSMLTVTTDMIQNFNTLYDTVGQIYFSSDELATSDNKPTEIAMMLRRELAREYLPQLDYYQLDDMVDRVKVLANERILQGRVSKLKIEQDDIKTLKSGNLSDEGETSP